MKEKGFCLLLLSSGSQEKHGPVSPEQVRHRQRRPNRPEITLPQQAESLLHLLDCNLLPYHRGTGVGEQPQSRGPNSTPVPRKTEGYTAVKEPPFNTGLLKSCMEHYAQICFRSQERRPWNEGWAQCPTHRSQTGPVKSFTPGKYGKTLTRQGPGIPYTNPTHPKSSPHPHSALTPTAH